ncbi:MAG TPA: CoA pyrophosphatase [Patescibacteria group bacterium]|jgi:8-oxo-dGTP pyrophosphatase MutT (NUDIX family)|nr:CoA pyrophosphatase [Patescibacteria group bacterium]
MENHALRNLAGRSDAAGVADRFFVALRGALSPVTVSDPPPPGLRSAGVLVPLRVSGGEITVTLARRTERVPHHKGQICFPGGSRDPGDRDLLGTALREAEEELGIRGADVELLGAMERVPTVTGFCIQPFVARIPPDARFHLDGFEMAETFDAPLSAFTDFSRYRAAGTTFLGKPYMVYFLDYDRFTIWGATARILHDLADLLRGTGASSR